MQTTLTVHDVNLSAAERLRLGELNARLQRYFRKLVTLSWEIRDSAHQYVVRCSVHSLSGYYRARASADSAGAALDQVFDKLVRQRRRTRAISIRARKRDGVAGRS